MKLELPSHDQPLTQVRIGDVCHTFDATAHKTVEIEDGDTEIVAEALNAAGKVVGEPWLLRKPAPKPAPTPKPAPKLADKPPVKAADKPTPKLE
jgi:hypothetical protein